MSNFQEDSFQKRIKRKISWTLITVWISLIFTSFLILFFTPDSILYLYMLIASLIILGDAAFLKVLYQYPDPIERTKVEILLGLLVLVGISFSWLIWTKMISVSFARLACMSAGIGVSEFTGIFLIRYFTQVKVRQ